MLVTRPSARRSIYMPPFTCLMPRLGSFLATPSAPARSQVSFFVLKILSRRSTTSIIINSSNPDRLRCTAPHSYHQQLPVLNDITQGLTAGGTILLRRPCHRRGDSITIFHRGIKASSCVSTCLARAFTHSLTGGAPLQPLPFYPFVFNHFNFSIGKNITLSSTFSYYFLILHLAPHTSSIGFLINQSTTRVC
jgi:hypothetical protein